MKAQTKIIIGIVAGFLVGFGVAWLVLNRPGVPANTDQPTTETVEEERDSANEVAVSADDRSPIATSTVVDQELIEVKDQAAGETVFISRVALQETGWVVIREGESSTMLGNILGARRFDAGMYQGTVTLLRGTEAGERYYASLWRDNGDQLFDMDTDTPITPQVIMAFEVY